jgi:ribonuclease T1
VLLFGRSARCVRRSQSLFSVAFLASSLLAASGAMARQMGEERVDGLPTVQLSSLPMQAQATRQLIQAGGPFPYSKDGSVFGNRERQLPSKRRGFYREYTVETPGVRSRGARRIVCGGQQMTQPENCFYTGDHYQSFYLIRE